MKRRTINKRVSDWYQMTCLHVQQGNLVLIKVHVSLFLTDIIKSRFISSI